MARTASTPRTAKRKNLSSSHDEQPNRKVKKPVTDENEQEMGDSDGEFENEDFEDNAMEVDETNNDSNQNQEKPFNPNKQSSKEQHEAQKVLRLERKAQKPHAELLQHCKKVWEKARTKELAKGEQEKMISDMIILLKGRVVELSFKHDASRIVQTCLKYGSNSHRELIAKELIGHYLELSKAKYGRFIVMKILKYCRIQREAIIKEFYGNVQKLIRQKEASLVLEEAYSQYANAVQRASLIQEFYGPEFAIFKTGNEKLSLSEILAAHPEKKSNIMKHLQYTLSQVLDKGTINHSIVHRALLEYFKSAEPSQIQDMIGQLKELAVEILHTKEGSQVAINCLLYGNVKDRKVLVKSFKPFVEKIAKEEYGHVVLLQLLDVIDDTVLVDKSIISELAKKFSTLINDKFARRVIGYLLVGRSKKYLSTPTVEMLKSNDTVRAETSKKDVTQRASELNKFASKYLLEYTEAHVSQMIFDPFPSQILGDVLICGTGDRSKLISSITDLIKQEVGESHDGHVMNHIIANRVLKSLIQASKEEGQEIQFAQIIFDALTPEKIKLFSTSWGSFVILALLEAPSTEEQVRPILKSHLKQLKKAVEDGNKGAKIIIEKLEK